jgi:hypothetical protein
MRDRGRTIQPCWVTIGVLSSVDHDGNRGLPVGSFRFRRAQIRQTYMQLDAVGRSVCVQFVLGSSALQELRSRPARHRPLQSEMRQHDDIVWVHVDDRNCALKSLSWFARAARKYPDATFIGKADDDIVLHVEHLRYDLIKLSQRAVTTGSTVASRLYVGLFMWVPSWNVTARSGWPCGRIRQFDALWVDNRSLVGAFGHRCAADAASGNVTGPFPFASGPLYLMSRPLVSQVFGASRSARMEHWLSGLTEHASDKACGAEDALVGYLVHLAATVRGFTYTLAHMTWTKMINFNRILGGNRSGMGWFSPSSSTVSVHGLKRGSQEAWQLAWRAQQDAGIQGGSCLPIRFQWTPSTHRGFCEDASVWKNYVQCCGV